MSTIILLLLGGIFMNGEKLLFDFKNSGSIKIWRKVNDVVMGGVSKSNLELTESGNARFSGILSPENNGGFASYRTSIDDIQIDEYKGVIIKAKGDGNLYNIRFRTDINFDGYSYQAKFKSEKDNWVEIKIPFETFIPTFRGRTLQNKPKLESKNIKQIGILIADKQFGEFIIDIDWIKLY